MTSWSSHSHFAFLTISRKSFRHIIFRFCFNNSTLPPSPPQKNITEFKAISQKNRRDCRILQAKIKTKQQPKTQIKKKTELSKTLPYNKAEHRFVKLIMWWINRYIHFVSFPWVLFLLELHLNLHHLLQWDSNSLGTDAHAGKKQDANVR